ncbi:unnamed protein product [Coccothraustes coccothraustes]
MAAGTRGTPPPSDPSKRTREEPGEVRSSGHGRALERFLPSLVSRGVSSAAAGLWETDREPRPESEPPLAAAALGRHPVVPLGAAAPEGARERRGTGWQSLRDSDPCACRASPRAYGTWGHAWRRGGLRAPPAPEARTPCMAHCPLLSRGKPSPHGPSETRQRRCFSRSLARLLCNPAPLTARVCRLYLPMPSTDCLAFVPAPACPPDSHLQACNSSSKHHGPEA